MKEALGCVLLCAGQGKRFGGSKLTALFRGKPLFEYAMDAVPEALLPQTVVVSGENAILSCAESRGMGTVINDRPELGISRSIRLGTEALSGCGGILYLVGDQPLLHQDTVCMIVDRFIENPDSIIVPVNKEGKTGNPCLFPARFFPELCALEGDRGGKKVIAAHPEAVELVTVEDYALIDTDLREELERLEIVVSGQ